MNHAGRAGASLTLSMALLAAAAFLAGAEGAGGTLVVRAGLLFDGTQFIDQPTDVEIRDGKIEAVRPAAGAADIDLGPRLLAPGLIDTHVHLGWYITAEGRLHVPGDGEDERTAILNAAGNAWRMLQAGFTTLQSVGAPADATVRDAIDRGVIPGPRLLSSLGRITPTDARKGRSFWARVKGFFGIGDGGGAEAVRAAVGRLAARGADLIKIFARRGKDRALAPAQLVAACGAAREAGLRSVVHAMEPEDVKNAVRAGCTQIDHGVYADDEVLKMIADAGLYFEPQCSLVYENYLRHWDWFDGLPGWGAEWHAEAQRLVENRRERGAKWLSMPKLKIVFGSDAVAGAHGLNAADLVCRIRDLGQPVADALRTATLAAAESLELGDRIGRVAPGYEADLVAFDGDPRDAPDAFMRAAFVMKGGTVYRLPPEVAGPARTYTAP